MKRSLFAELRRRNVLRAGAFYIAATWALAQGISQLEPHDLCLDPDSDYLRDDSRFHALAKSDDDAGKGGAAHE
jgi:hypothetical protein